MLHLIATTGPDEDRVFRFESPQFVLGRAGDVDASLQYPTDRSMSREHVQVRVSDAGVSLVLISETGRLLVGSTPVSEATVPWGGVFQLGSTEFRVERPARTGRAGVPRRALAEFELGDELGEGMSARVYKAVDKASGEALAIKLLKPDMAPHEPVVAAFAREMAIHADLRHPNIVRILCVGREKADLFIGMELIEGFDLAEHVEGVGPLSPVDACHVGIGLLRGLEFAHGLGLVHRDVKPNNVLIDGDDYRKAKLGDFGMAKYLRRTAAEETLTGTGEARGTLLYSPPECLRDAKRAQPAADIFGVGTTLYFALTGHVWFDEVKYANDILTAVLSVDLMPLSERNQVVPAALAEVVDGAIRADPEDRWASASEMLARLEAVLPDLT